MSAETAFVLGLVIGFVLARIFRHKPGPDLPGPFPDEDGGEE